MSDELEYKYFSEYDIKPINTYFGTLNCFLNPPKLPTVLIPKHFSDKSEMYLYKDKIPFEQLESYGSDPKLIIQENEEADKLADKIYNLLSNRKRKQLYDEFQKFILLRSPISDSQLRNKMKEIGNILGPLKQSIFPAMHSYLKNIPIDKNINSNPEIKQEVLELQSIVDSASNLSNLWEYINKYIIV